MSKTVDERVLSMQFDNKHFESNMRTTMSTLERFKQSLNLKGAEKGFETMGSAVKKVDMSGLGKSVETVRMQFSALEVMGVTALANITNSAVNAGKRIAKALTIDPIKTGFNEYETKMNSIQTIMSNTASKGTTMEDVTRVIDELNTYADKTIYNFTEMTRNIGTFTAAGVGLEESASAIQGIANLAAASGSNSQQASTAMYQLSQALATGTVKLMDWNSVVNAGMGGELFQNALKDTAKAHGVAVDEIIKKSGSFRDSLKEEWLTADILTETLQKMTKSGAAEYLSKLTGVSQDQITAAQKLADETKNSDKAYNDLAESMAATGKISKEQALSILKQADNAENAATKVKTATQLFDTLKESVQSGWGKTWEIIFGDFDKAQDLFTGISDFLGGFIGKMSDARNNLLEGALNLASPWTKIMDKLEGSGLGKIKDVAESVGNAADKLKYFQDVVTDVWRGDYKNSDTGRFDLLKNAGYDDRVVQELVNKGYGYKLTVEDIEAAHKKFGLTMGTTAEETKKLTDSFDELSEEKLKEAGLTEDEIKLYQDLQEEAKRTGKSVSELADEMSKNDGRTLLIESFKNAGLGLVAVFKAIGQAWVEIFPPMSVVQLYNIIKSINEFSQHLKVGDETADKLKRTLKGVFALLDIVLTIVGGPVKFAFKTLIDVLGAFDLNILDVTANMGDAIVKFRDWIDEHNIFVKGIKAAPEFLAKFAKNVQKWLTSVREVDNLGEYIIDGLINGIKNGGKKVVTGIINFAKSIITSFCDVMGIESPSKVFFEFGQFIIQGLVNGIQNGLGWIVDTVKSIGTKIIDTFSKIDFGAIFMALSAAGVFVVGNKLADALGAIASPIEGIGEMMKGAGEVMQKASKGIKKVLKSFANVMNSVAFSIKVNALKNLAISIAILVGAIAALAFMNKMGMKEDLKTAIAMIGVLAIILGVLAIAVSKLAESSMTIGKDGMKIGSLSTTLIAIGAAMLLMATAVKMIAKLDSTQCEQGLIGLAAIIVGLTAFMGVCGLIMKDTTNIMKLGGTLIGLSVSLVLLVGVIKLVSKLSVEEMQKGGLFAAAFLIFISTLLFVSQGMSGNIGKLGGMLIGLSVSLILLIGVVKLAAKLTPEEMIQGAKFAAGFLVFVGGLLLISKLAKGELPKLGGMLLAMSTAMLLLVGVVKLVGLLDETEMIKGVAFMGAFLLFTYAIAMIAKKAGPDIAKLGGTILAMSVAIGLLAGICVLLGYVNPEKLKQGMKAVGILSAMMAGLLFMARGVGDVGDTVKGIAITIGVLAASLFALSFIEPTKLIAPTIAMGLLMGMFAVIMKSSKNVTGSLGVMITMAATIAIMGIALGELAKQPWQNTLAAAGALSLVMLVMVGVLKIIGTISPLALSGVVTMGALAIVVGLLGGILYLLKDLPAESSIATAQSLSILLLAMSASLLILSAVGMVAPAAIVGVGALIAMVTAIGVFIAALAGLNALIPELGTFLDTGIVILEKIGYAMGAFVGSIVEGFAANVLAILPTIGVSLSAFMVAAMPFISGLKMVDKQTLAGAGFLAGAIIALTVAELINGIASFVPGTMATMGAELSAFMIAAMPFISMASMLDENMMAGVKALAETILILTAADILNGLTSWFTGGSSLENFATQLPILGTGIRNFLNNVGTFSDAEVATVNAAASAVKTLAKAAQEIPNTGGLLADLVGDNELGTFASQFPTLGTGLRSFLSNIGTFSDAEVTTVTAAANAVKTLAKAASEIPNMGGLLASIVGDNGLGTFASQFPALGTGLRAFLDNIGTFSDAEIATVTAGANAMKTLAKASQEIPNTGGLLAALIGDNDMSTFATDLTAFGKGLKSFADEVDGIDADTVTPAVEAGKKLVDLAKAMPESEGWIEKLIFGSDDMDEFAESLEAFGEGIADFADEVEDINVEAVAAGVDAAKKIIDMSDDVDNIADMFEDADEMDAFADNLAAFGEGIGAFGEATNGVDGAIVSEGARAGKSIADMAGSIAKSGGVPVFGEGSTMATFGTQLTSFGAAVRSFAMIMSGVDFSYVNSGVTAGKQIAGMANSIANVGGIASFFGKGIKMDSFGVELASFGHSIRRFSQAVSGIDVSSIPGAVSAGKSMITLTKTAPGAANLDKAGVQLVSFGHSIRLFAMEIGEIGVSVLSKNIQQINNALRNVSSLGIDSFVDNFSKAKGRVGEVVSSMLLAVVTKIDSYKGKFSSAGEAIIDSFGNAVNTKRTKVSQIFATMMADALTKVSGTSIYNSFYYAGMNVATGFANGISANSYKAAAKAAAMAEAAKEAAKAALKINSPSKVFYAIGSGVIEGFTNALSDGDSTVYRSASDLATFTNNGFKNTLLGIKDLIEGNIDAQPTIRPVLDLSEVSAGVGSLNGMLNTSPSLGLMTNINAINSTMGRGQNGGNADVISALKDLKRSISGMPRNTYNVNGVTYDDGSNVSEAVKSLVRAAKIERRI